MHELKIELLVLAIIPWDEWAKIDGNFSFFKIAGE
jgi:hypothetical protein